MMNYFGRLLTFIMLNAIGFCAHASDCNCVWQGPFSKIVDKADLIASGTIVRSKGNALDLHIEKLLIDKARGGREFNEQIRIWTSDGKQCRPTSDQFPINSRWLMALHKINNVPSGGFNPNTPSISYGREKDYYLSKCGVYWLALHDGYVSGNLVNKQRWLWEDKAMNPVLLELIDAYIRGLIPEQALIEAAKPQTRGKKLMEETKQFLQTQ